MTDPAFQRLAMVRDQIERRGVRDRRVLSAMETVPREAFVPVRLRHRAFEDGALPIDCGQTISQPYVVASMCEALKLPREGARVLEIGTGSGYAAAVLAQIAEEVYTVERLESLAASATRRLSEQGYGRVRVRCGDGSLGWPDHAPYDGILVSAGSPNVPAALEEQLEIGGHLVVPIGRSRYDQSLVRVTRRDETTYKETRLGGVRFVPLIGEQGWREDDPADRGGWFLA